MKTGFRFSVLVKNSIYESALARLYLTGMEGCEESVGGDGSVKIDAFFSSIKTAELAATYVNELLVQTIAPPIVAVPDQDWNATWRKSMKPAQLAPAWWVSPTWLPPPNNDGNHWIKIEPKMAFGTGHHESTRLAARALIDESKKVKGASLLDIGTGSGVLCFTGGLLGAAIITGLDIDPNCRENLSENRKNNCDAGPCNFIIGTLDAFKVDSYFTVIIMNMIHTESAPLLHDCKRAIGNGGVLIWSGILNGEQDVSILAAEKAGFSFCRDYIENEWWCGVFLHHDMR